MSMKLMTGAALAAAVLAGAAPAEAQSFQNLVETFYDNEFRAHPIAATRFGVHDYDAKVDDLSRDGQSKNTAFVTLRGPDWIVPTGGGYFFAPSIGAIRDRLSRADATGAGPR